MTRSTRLAVDSPDEIPAGIARPPANSALAGIGLMLTGIALFSINDALGKWLLATYSVAELLLIRSVAALILLAPFVRQAGIAAFTRAPRPGLQILRVVLSTLEVAMFFWAVSYLPLADTVTFYLAGPIYVTALSVIVLGEKVGWRRWTAVLVGFAGVVLALRPSAASFTLPALIALTGSLIFAGLMIVTRLLRETSNTVLVAGQLGGTLLLGAVLAPFGWVTPSPLDLALLSLFGVFSIMALVCVNLSLKRSGGQRRGALPIHDHRLGDRAGLCRVRRRARRPHARRRGRHRRRRALHLLARAEAGRAGSDAAAPPVSSSRTAASRSFDHLVGAQQERRRQLDADRFGGLEIDDQLKPGRLLDRQIGGLRTVENLRHVGGDAAQARLDMDSVGHEPARLDVGPEDEHRRKAVLKGQLRDVALVRGKQGTGQNEQHLRRALGQGPECRIDIIWQALELHAAQLKPESARPVLRGAELVGRPSVPQHPQAGLVGNVCVSSSTCFSANSG